MILELCFNACVGGFAGCCLRVDRFAGLFVSDGLVCV